MYVRAVVKTLVDNGLATETQAKLALHSQTKNTTSCLRLGVAMALDGSHYIELLVCWRSKTSTEQATYEIRWLVLSLLCTSVPGNAVYSTVINHGALPCLPKPTL